MSEKNFVAYGDAESILTGYANRIKQSPSTFVGTQAQWNALSSSQKAEYELVDITDDSLSPNSFVDWGSYGELGVKNLTPSKEISQTKNGIVFVVDSDGIVTLNQTADNTTFRSTISGNDANNIKLYLKAGSYIYSLCDADISGVSIVVKDMNNVDVLRTTTLTGATFTLAEDKDVTIDWRIETGTSFSNTKFKAMLRLANDIDSTYQPYAMTNKEMTPYVQAISNPNLLDNPWFTVNQRGNTFYQTENGYCVDRWILGKGAFTARETNAPYGVLQTRVANTNGWLRQKTEFELDTTKPITYSAIISASVTSDYGFALKFSNMDDYNDSKMKWFPTTANKKILVYFTDLPFKNTAFEVVANAGASSTVKIYALKAELGTVSTLAMDSAPNYVSELLKCQRYFVRFSAGAISTGLLSAYAYSAGAVRFSVPLPVKMRVFPTINYSNLNDWGISQDSVQNAVSPTSITLATRVEAIMVVDFASNSYIAQTPYVLCCKTAGAYIDFSADL